MSRETKRSARLVFLLLLLTLWAGSLSGQVGPAVYNFTVYATYAFNVLSNPTGLAVTAPYFNGVPQAPHFFIADSGNHVIREFTGSTLSVVAGAVGASGYVDSSTFSLARFNNPTGLTAFSNGWTTNGTNWYAFYLIYVGDTGNHVMRRIGKGSYPPGGYVLNGVQTIAGSQVQGFSDGPSASARFARLGGVTNSAAPLYVADSENHAIRAWDGSNVTTFAGTGTPGLSDGYRTTAQFDVPTEVVWGPGGVMYVADMGNHVIRKIDSAGNVTVFAGTGEPGYADGPGNSAKFNMPSSILFNSADNYFYVADATNNMIRRIDLSGNVSTYAGAQVGGLVNGSLTVARFRCPMKVLVYGNFLYITDSMNNCIRRIDMATGTVTTYIS